MGNEFDSEYLNVMVFYVHAPAYFNQASLTSVINPQLLYIAVAKVMVY